MTKKHRVKTEEHGVEIGQTGRNRSGIPLLAWRIVLIVLGLTMLVGGMLRDDVLQMWRRATQLCLGCIGIG